MCRGRGQRETPASKDVDQAIESRDDFQPDGRYRIVAGPEDPGVPNWIDTTGQRRGGLRWRFVSGENVPEAPTVRVVRTSELR